MKKNTMIATLVKLSWRNVAKNRRRTVLTTLTIAAGSSMIILLQSFFYGGFDALVGNSTAENAGHIQIHERGFQANQSIDYAFEPTPRLMDRLRTDPAIAAFSRRIHAGGLLSRGNATAGVMLQAVDPEAERRVTRLHEGVVRGRYLVPGDDRQVLLGEVLAKNLRAGVGDEVDLMLQGFDGAIVGKKLEVVGIVRSHNPELNRGLVLMNFDAAAEGFAMMGFISSLTIRLRDLADLDAARARIETWLDPRRHEVMGWGELLPQLLQIISINSFIGDLFKGILYVVIAFGIYNTIQMSIHERTYEFGVMLAIGTRPDHIRAMVVMESIVIASCGVLAGVAAGSLLSWHFAAHPIDFSAQSKALEIWGTSAISAVGAKLTAGTVISTAFVTLALAAASTALPAHRASRMRPIEAMRSA